MGRILGFLLIVLLSGAIIGLVVWGAKFLLSAWQTIRREKREQQNHDKTRPPVN